MILRRHATAVVHGAAVETNTDGESGGGPAVRTDVGSFQTRFARLPTAHVPQPTAPPARTAHGSSPPGRRAVGPLRALWPPGARGSRQSGSGAPMSMGVLRASRVRPQVRVLLAKHWPEIQPEKGQLHQPVHKSAKGASDTCACITVCSVASWGIELPGYTPPTLHLLTYYYFHF